MPFDLGASAWVLLAASLASAPRGRAPKPEPEPELDPSYQVGHRLGLDVPPRPWPRKHGWMAARLTLGGSVSGTPPAATSVVAVGGAVDLGWRIDDRFAIGIGIDRRPHSVTNIDATAIGLGVLRDRGHLTSFDLLFARAYLPVTWAWQPYVDLGGGFAVVEPSSPRVPVRYAGQVRSAIGFDAWLLPSLSLGAGVLYRAVVFGHSSSHGLHGYVELALHF